MTSVGSGCLMIVMLLVLYPMLRSSELVGTDLVQAIPLVASAAAGHLLFGDFKVDLTAWLLIGSLPGVYLGARLSSRANDAVIRPALALVLVASGLKLLGVDNLQTGLLMLKLLLLAAAVVPAVIWVRRRPRRVYAAVGLLLPRPPGPGPGVVAAGPGLAGRVRLSGGRPLGLGFVAALAYFGFLAAAGGSGPSRARPGRAASNDPACAKLRRLPPLREACRVIAGCRRVLEDAADLRGQRSSR
jgi:sulfite exporter TauE/SafE